MSYKQVKFEKFKKFLGGCMLQSAQAAQQPTYLTLPWTSCKAKLIRTFPDYRAYIKVEWLKCKWLFFFYYFTSVTYYSLFFQYMFPWGQESVDSITVRSDLHKCIGTDEFRGLPFNKKSIPHVIQVKTDLNRGKFLFVTVLGLQYFCYPFLVFGFC